MTSPAVVRTGPTRVAAAAVAVVGAFSLLDPNRTHVPLCPFHVVTGLDCPLCGSLRAVHELTRGHLAVALRDNVLLVGAVPVALAAWLVWLVDARTGRLRTRRRWSRAATIATVAAMLVFTVLRNLPLAAALRPA